MKRTELTAYLIGGSMTLERYNAMNALSDKELADYSVVGGEIVKAITLDSLQAFALYDFNRMSVYASTHADIKGFQPYKDIEIAVWLKAFGTDTHFIAVPTTFEKRVKADDGYTVVEVKGYQPQLLNSDDDITERLAHAYTQIKSDMNAYTCTRQRLTKGGKQKG